jgi:cupin fold WbuC family metalloprotein|tara:strand:+ start:976 stop:1482 length:507 start_codon:yes stop_codon:yes gene_type:complete
MKNKYLIQNKKDLVVLSKKVIVEIKGMALKNKKKRARICLHKSTKDKTNEMIIALHKKSFIAPHIHPNKKSESYFILEGAMHVYIFDRMGKVKQIVKMGTINSGKKFYYRMCRGFFHMPIAVSKWCVYHEVYSGPFVKEKDVFYPDWAPDESNNLKKNLFLKKIKFKS